MFKGLTLDSFARGRRNWFLNVTGAELSAVSVKDALVQFLHCNFTNIRGDMLGAAMTIDTSIAAGDAATSADGGSTKQRYAPVT